MNARDHGDVMEVVEEDDEFDEEVFAIMTSHGGGLRAGHLKEEEIGNPSPHVSSSSFSPAPAPAPAPAPLQSFPRGSGSVASDRVPSGSSGSTRPPKNDDDEYEDEYEEDEFEDEDDEDDESANKHASRVRNDDDKVGERRMILPDRTEKTPWDDDEEEVEEEEKEDTELAAETPVRMDDRRADGNSSPRHRVPSSDGDDGDESYDDEDFEEGTPSETQAKKGKMLTFESRIPGDKIRSNDSSRSVIPGHISTTPHARSFQSEREEIEQAVLRMRREDPNLSSVGDESLSESQDFDLSNGDRNDICSTPFTLTGDQELPDDTFAPTSSNRLLQPPLELERISSSPRLDEDIDSLSLQTPVSYSPLRASLSTDRVSWEDNAVAKSAGKMETDISPIQREPSSPSIPDEEDFVEEEEYPDDFEHETDASSVHAQHEQQMVQTHTDQTKSIPPFISPVANSGSPVSLPIAVFPDIDAAASVELSTPSKIGNQVDRYAPGHSQESEMIKPNVKTSLKTFAVESSFLRECELSEQDISSHSSLSGDVSHDVSLQKTPESKTSPSNDAISAQVYSVKRNDDHPVVPPLPLDSRTYDSSYTTLSSDLRNDDLIPTVEYAHQEPSEKFILSWDILDTAARGVALGDLIAVDNIPFGKSIFSKASSGEVGESTPYLSISSASAPVHSPDRFDEFPCRVQFLKLVDKFMESPDSPLDVLISEGLISRRSTRYPSLKDITSQTLSPRPPAQPRSSYSVLQRKWEGRSSISKKRSVSRSHSATAVTGAMTTEQLSQQILMLGRRREEDIRLIQRLSRRKDIVREDRSQMVSYFQSRETERLGKEQRLLEEHLPHSRQWTQPFGKDPPLRGTGDARTRSFHEVFDGENLERFLMADSVVAPPLPSQKEWTVVDELLAWEEISDEDRLLSIGRYPYHTPSPFDLAKPPPPRPNFLPDLFLPHVSSVVSPRHGGVPEAHALSPRSKSAVSQTFPRTTSVLEEERSESVALSSRVSTGGADVAEDPEYPPRSSARTPTLILNSARYIGSAYGVPSHRTPRSSSVVGNSRKTRVPADRRSPRLFKPPLRPEHIGRELHGERKLAAKAKLAQNRHTREIVSVAKDSYLASDDGRSLPNTVHRINPASKLIDLIDRSRTHFEQSLREFSLGGHHRVEPKRVFHPSEIS